MIDAALTLIAALGLGACMTVVILDHTDRDDAVRAAHVDCRVDLATERLVADVCMATVEDCRALVEDFACTCWRPRDSFESAKLTTGEFNEP